MGLTVEIAQHAPVTILLALDVKECLQITKVENKVLPSVHSGLLDPLNVTIQLHAIIRRIVRSLLGDICPNCLEPGHNLGDSACLVYLQVPFCLLADPDSHHAHTFDYIPNR